MTSEAVGLDKVSEFVVVEGELPGAVLGEVPESFIGGWIIRGCKIRWSYRSDEVTIVMKL